MREAEGVEVVSLSEGSFSRAHTLLLVGPFPLGPTPPRRLDREA